MVQTSRIAFVLGLGFAVVLIFQLRTVFTLLSTPSAPGTLRGTFVNHQASDAGHDLVSLELRMEQIMKATRDQIAHGGAGSAEALSKAKSQIDELKSEMDHKLQLVKKLQQKQNKQHRKEALAAAGNGSNRIPKLDNGAGTPPSAIVAQVGNKATKDAAQTAVVRNNKGANSHGRDGGSVAVRNDPADAKVATAVNDGSSAFTPTREQRRLGLDSPMLVLCYSRDDYLKKTLETIYKYHPTVVHGRPSVPIVVSQDGNIEKVNKAIEALRDKFLAAGIPFAWIKHPKATRAKNGYEKLAQHFGWAFNQIFDNNAARSSASTDIYNYPQSMIATQVPAAARLIVLEEDIEIAPDFFSYFGAMAPLLDADPMLYSISAWNDNGMAKNVEGAHPDSVVRSDFFPGLGWMMNRDLWDELGPSWPTGYWDDWIREPDQRKGREVLRPEICRTFHFGAEGGTSAGQFNAYLKSIRLNSEVIDWEAEDLRYLQHDSFVETYQQQLALATKVSSLDEVANLQKGVPGHLEERYYRLEYRSVTGGRDSFMRLAKKIGLMDNEKAMVPRGAFKGVVQFRHAGGIVFLAPDPQTIDWNSCGGRCT